jgi:anaerobic magnesium-protoporphyrin IX monomethyl ester cyclase
VSKVLLAYRCSEEGEANPFERVLPVGLGYIHSHLRARGLPSVLANFSAMSAERIREILAAEQPDIVGLSTFTFNRSASVDLARSVKSVLPGALVVMGGPHPTHVGAPLLSSHPEVDLCVLGEGELTMERLARVRASGGDLAQVPGLLLRRDGGIFPTAAAEPIQDLDSLAFPARYPEGYGIDPRAQYPYIVTSRGCPAKCTFCSSPEFWGSRVRFRSASNILDELQLLKERFGIMYVSFRDDVFTLNKQRVIELCRGMIDRRLSLLWDCQTRVNNVDEERLIWMKRAGAMILQYGIESGSQRMLDRLGKGQKLKQIDHAAEITRRVGLMLSIYLIAGAHDEAEEDLLATEEMVRRIRPHDGIVTPLAVFPGTSLWDEHRVRANADDKIWETVGHDGVFVRPDRFTEDAILRLSSLLEEAAWDNAYKPEAFAEHRALHGECHAADLMEGESLEASGGTTQAESIYRRLAVREPWNPWPFLRLGRLALDGGDFARAERFFAAVLERVPAFADARYLRAAALRGLGREREAKEVLAELPLPGSGEGSRKIRRGFQSYPPARPLERSDAPR